MDGGVIIKTGEIKFRDVSESNSIELLAQGPPLIHAGDIDLITRAFMQGFRDLRRLTLRSRRQKIIYQL
jgi:hypothetical protein